MSADLIVFLLTSVFFLLNFFASQRLYSSSYFPGVALVIMVLSVAAFFILERQFSHTRSRLHWLVLLTTYYCVVLLIVKVVYKHLNNFLVRKQWIGEAYAEKDYTYVTHAYNGLGADIWNDKLAAKPSPLDYVISYSLLFVPMFLTIATYDLYYGH